ncbi:hypothetical protein HPB50_006348 [Hyalomma asiaticum]|uniref:Uncharacterized protein n=1 Tax=Hyalomma asiaticum TaxID=266040 RepID=A0ACB7RYE3_HYAAI|nr:hypothetical protein HPB50_006348 [Hyalomma asiaticum]
MGHAPEGLPRLLSGMVVREMIEGLHVDDLFNCARSDALWEEVALSTLSRKLRFFALLQDRLDDPLAHGKFVEELRSRLAVAEKASKRPSFAIILCAEKHYDFGTIASCFPADITVVRVDVQCPVVAQRRGIKERLDASVCVLVFFDSPGAAFECEWSPYIECGVPAFTSTLFDMLKRSMPLCGGEDVHRHRNTGMPARFALYITSTFTSGVIFKRQPSMYDVGLCMLWTPRLRVYQGAVDDTHSAHAYWGAMTFGENVKAMCLKYAAWTTVQQLWRHLDTVRTSLGDISDALVLFFQDQELKGACCGGDMPGIRRRCSRCRHCVLLSSGLEFVCTQPRTKWGCSKLTLRPDCSRSARRGH